MQITTANLITAIETWANKDLLARGSLLQKGLVTFLLLQGKVKIETFLAQIDFLSDNGNFDLDILHKNLQASLDAMNGVFTIPLINYNFDKQDLDKVFEYAKELAK